MVGYFYPRSPYGERHSGGDSMNIDVTDFYPRSPYGERPPSVMQEIAQQRISIHALLTESD